MIPLDVPPANDNGIAPAAREAKAPAAREEKAPAACAESAAQPGPVVSVPGNRAEHAYACAGNLILPLRFARRFPGWALQEEKSVTR